MAISNGLIVLDSDGKIFYERNIKALISDTRISSFFLDLKFDSTFSNMKSLIIYLCRCLLLAIWSIF